MTILENVIDKANKAELAICALAELLDDPKRFAQVVAGYYAHPDQQGEINGMISSFSGPDGVPETVRDLRKLMRGLAVQIVAAPSCVRGLKTGLAGLSPEEVPQPFPGAGYDADVYE